MVESFELEKERSRLERDVEAGTATVATRLVSRPSWISKLTQLRAQPATNRRHKGRPQISDYPEDKSNGSRDVEQRGKLGGGQRREEVEMDTAGDSMALSQHQMAPERLGEIGDLDRED
ncbi:hypothetical protein Rs2_06099 [Raphanus sativus]|nr:hypothetical protein Rs2_06099 [Raphanus sativus]